jgi:Protein of unknown function (DUF1573).
MKKVLITFFTISMISYCFGQELAVSTVSGEKASLHASFHWANTVYDFGKTKIGIPVAYEFRFTNTGAVPLLVTSVKASCGCTVTAYTKDPVKKGDSGFVRATYNAASVGVYNKTVDVYANTAEGKMKLTIRGEIVQ